MASGNTPHRNWRLISLILTIMLAMGFLRSVGLGPLAALPFTLLSGFARANDTNNNSPGLPLVINTVRVSRGRFLPADRPRDS